MKSNKFLIIFKKKFNNIQIVGENECSNLYGHMDYSVYAIYLPKIMYKSLKSD